MIDFISGKKTYLMIAAALVYLLGGKLQFWKVDGEIVASIGLLVAAFLRAGVQKAQNEVAASPTSQTGPSSPPRPPGLPLFFLALCSLCLLCGCAFHSSKLYDPSSGKLVAKVRTYTLWDSESSLAKLHIDTVAVTNKNGTWSPGISISGLNQESSSTNINELAGTIMKGAIQGAIQALGKP